ncbi:serine/threonine-protein kinase pdik1l-B-like [Branchiostoma floridae x Branchiostoma japonicum]
MHAWENPLYLEGYSFGEEIGRGASGTVYTVKSTDTGRTYAAKKLAVEDTSINEICVLTQLKKHPNIMEFLESKAGRDGERDALFVISEFCPLGNIGDYILKQQIDVVTKRNLAVQLADAMTFLHKNGVVHRDIKPQNVLLTGTEAHLVLKVVDFGLAKILTDMDNGVNSFTRSYMRSAVGTRFYLSPEIYQSHLDDQPCLYTPSMDIFSMGLLLWAMFDGLSIPGSCQKDRYLTPFAGEETDPMPVAQAITQGNIELRIMEREENTRCKNLVQRMLSRDPKERPIVEEVLQTLLRASSSELGRFRPRLRHIRAASLVLKDTADDTLDRAKENHCAVEECPNGFLQGIGNPLCRRDRGFFNSTPSVEQIGAKIVETDLALKVWSCVLEPVFEEMGDEDESGEGDSTASIASQVETVREMMENMGLPQAFSDAPCSLVLLQAFKRQAETFSDQVTVMATSTNPHAQQ